MPNPHPLTGQAALVTGGTRGIGRAVAASLLEAGAQVVLTGTRREAAEETAAALNRGSSAGAGAHGAACDVTDDASVANLVAFIRERCGRLGHSGEQRRGRDLPPHSGALAGRLPPRRRHEPDGRLPGDEGLFAASFAGGRGTSQRRTLGRDHCEHWKPGRPSSVQGRRRLQRVQVRTRRPQRGDDARPAGRRHPGGDGHAR